MDFLEQKWTPETSELRGSNFGSSSLNPGSIIITVVMDFTKRGVFLPHSQSPLSNPAKGRLNRVPYVRGGRGRGGGGGEGGW